VSVPFDSRSVNAATTSEEGVETGLAPAVAGEAAKAGQVTATVTEAAQARPKFIPPNFERMPPELKVLRNWVMWAPVWSGSKWTKRPMQTNGYGASTTKPQHWSSFDDVKRAYELGVARGYMEVHEKGKPVQQLPVGGVGFIFDGQPDADGLVFAGVDFDKVIPPIGEISSFAAERVKRLGSYFEQSVSETGLHVILKARPLAHGIAHNGTELYTGGRFFTMTGHAPKGIKIIAAPEAFAALALELQAQKASSSTDGDNCAAASSPKDNEQTADTDSNAWFDKLPPEKQSDVVRYAALHIAKNSKVFALTKHGGNYREYFNISLAIARSGVPDADDIFVEAASAATDADSEGELRTFFESCTRAEPQANGITVGTLIHTAFRFGADFNPWKRADCDRSVTVLYVPGNEEECRRRLDHAVAADPRTYTLGDPTGPLVILRVPNKDALPPETRWEGDLPGTTLAATADIMERAERLSWMKQGRFGPFRVHPPRNFVADYLIQMRGRYGARPLRGIVRVPYIDDGGEVHFNAGYDLRTGLFHDQAPTFGVKPNPTLDDAREAAELLLYPFSKYQFDDPVAGRALLLAAVFTAIERPYLPVAPMFVIRSSMPGTGKGLIARTLARIAFDTAPVFITWGGSAEEFEKRLGALLLQSPSILSIDNANGMQIKGDLLESLITEGSADIRPLGYSKIIKVKNRSFVTLTGNNPIITGDMARRSLSIDILPRSADPERDRYPFNPPLLVQQRRGDFLMAAFVAMKAFRLAGMPDQRLPAVGSFDDWTRKVRDLVHWVTDYDVSEAFRRNKAEDPRRQSDASLLAALHNHFKNKPFKAADAVAVCERVKTSHRSGNLTVTTTELALHEAAEDALGSRGVNAKVFGYWARRVKGARNGGFLLETNHNTTTNANEITVQKL
jgi:putative DNA primase/helicase